MNDELRKVLDKLDDIIVTLKELDFNYLFLIDHDDGLAVRGYGHPKDIASMALLVTRTQLKAIPKGLRGLILSQMVQLLVDYDYEAPNDGDEFDVDTLLKEVLKGSNNKED